MKTLQEIKQFYETELLADLKVLEQKRRGILQKFIFVGIAILFIAGLSVVIFLGNPNIGPGIIFVPVVI